jgi:predicted Zn-dependent protease
VPLVVLALVACAWFAIGIRDAQDTDQATAILSASSHPAPAAARRVASLLDSAGLLNPDRQLDLLRGQLALQLGHAALARRIFARVTREEPQNIQAWDWLGRAAARGSRIQVLAFDHILLLAPPIK